MIIDLLIASVLFFTTIALSWRDLRFGLYLLIFTLPLDNRVLFTLGFPRLLPVRVILIALVLIAFWKWKKKFEVDSVALILLALWLIRVVSLINTLSLKNSFSLLAFYSTMVVLYFVLKSVFAIYGTDFILRLFYLYLAVGVLTGIVSIIQYLSFHLFGIVLPAVWPTEHQPVRVGSTFWDINHYAAYLLTIIPSLSALAIFAKKFRERLVLWGAFFFALLVLGMTLSRSGWIASALAMGLMLILLLFKRFFSEVKPLLLALGVVSVAIVLGTIFFDLPVADRLYTFLDIYNNDAIQAHALILKGGFEVFTQHPLIGGGYGGFNEHFRQTAVAEQYFEKDPVHDVHLPAHSIWMEVLSETGILGFGLYLTLMFLVLGSIWKAIFKSRDRFLNLLNIATFSSLIGLLVSGIFYSYNLEFFWFFIFVSLFLARESAV